MLTHPTFTHVPPNRALSIAIVFAPCIPLALRAQAIPPLPPPITKKSTSFVVGAILPTETENCRDTPASLVVALADEGARVRKECRSNSLATFGIELGEGDEEN